MGAGGRKVNKQLTRRESIREKDHDMFNCQSILDKANTPMVEIVFYPAMNKERSWVHLCVTVCNTEPFQNPSACPENLSICLSTRSSFSKSVHLSFAAMNGVDRSMGIRFRVKDMLDLLLLLLLKLLLLLLKGIRIVVLSARITGVGAGGRLLLMLLMLGFVLGFDRGVI